METNEMNQIARHAFTTRETAKSCVAAFAKGAIEDEKKRGDSPDKWIEYYSIRVKDYSESAVDIIFDNSESEIEKVFLGTLLLSYLRSNPMGLIFRARMKNANKQIQSFREDINNCLAYYNQFKLESGGDESIDAFRSWLTSLERKAGRVMEFKEAVIENVLLDQMGTFDTYHLAVQATFPDIKVQNRHIRADILVWIPKMDNIKIIIECDGFQTHGEKDKFISDRKRDRVLKASGFDVLRYSGTEIYNDPIQTSFEFFNFLQDKMDIIRKERQLNNN